MKLLEGFGYLEKKSCILRSSFFIFLHSSFTNSQAKITKKKANQQRRRKQQTQINQKQRTHSSAIWTSVAELLNSSCDDHRHRRQCSDLMDGCGLGVISQPEPKPFLWFVGLFLKWVWFLPWVGVFGFVGLFFRMKNKGKRRRKNIGKTKEQGTQVWNTRFPTWKIESQCLNLLDC